MTAMLSLLSAAAVAQTPNFAGQRIELIVGAGAGGGFDAYARLVGRHLGSYLPGNPNIVVEDMPGAGSLTAANWLTNSAPRDGTAIAILPNPVLFEPLFGNHNAHFDPRKVNWLASLNDYIPVAAVWSQSPIRTVNDALNNEVLTGGQGSASDTTVWPNLLNSLINTKFKVISGYTGTTGIELAMERGEVEAMVGDDWDSIKAQKPDWLRDNKIRIILQSTLTRTKELPDVPTALELVGAENHDSLALLIARDTYGRPFLAPPEVPAPVVAALRQGFAKMLDDARFRLEAKQAGLPIHAVGGEAMTGTLAKLLASPTEVVARATAELRKFDPQ
jgi:tripartite-type tricarboxylate transporter receptor subunit TctC